MNKVGAMVKVVMWDGKEMVEVVRGEVLEVKEGWLTVADPKGGSDEYPTVLCYAA